MTASQPEHTADGMVDQGTDDARRQGPLLVGARLGRYRVQRKLGAGGMGTVFEAVHEDIGQRAAIKVLHPQLSRNSKQVARFLGEARLIGQVGHPGLVKVFDYIQGDDGTQFIVMELLDGVPLRIRIAEQADRHGRSGLPEEDTVPIARQIASALDAVHRRGIVHRDLKPENIMLVPDPETPSGERAKVLDFGIAKLDGEDGAPDTTRGVPLGTPAYMAPEQVEHIHPPSDRIDVYALGIVLYEMLSGAPPFSADTASGILRQHLVREPPPLPGTVSPNVQRLVGEMLVKDPQRRPSMRQVLSALDLLQTGHRASRSQASERPRWHRRAAAGAVAAMLALSVGTSVLVLRQPGPPPRSPPPPPAAAQRPAEPVASAVVVPPVVPPAVEKKVPVEPLPLPVSREPKLPRGDGKRRADKTLPPHFGDLPAKQVP